MVRNELFGQLVENGFRSIAIETDRVAAFVVDDYIQGRTGSLEVAMSEGFSHGFGEFDTNRRLVAWLREYNQGRPPQERVTFHGFDISAETFSAPSPRRYLEYARDYLRATGTDSDIDAEIAALAGDDERWSSTDAVMDPAASPGATPEADRLWRIADDMLITLHTRAPKLVAATSRAEWYRARAQLRAGIDLLRYHRQAAQPLEQTARWTRMCATRDAGMAENLFDIRDIEATRGPTLVFAHNVHLQRNQSTMQMGPMEITWYSAGAIVASLLGERYVFVASSLGRSDTLALDDPGPGTYEGRLQGRTAAWELLSADAAAGAAGVRTDTTPEQGYFPLDAATVAAADAVLHISDAAKVGPG